MHRSPIVLAATVAAGATLTLAAAASAQHSDIDFAYDNGKIAVEFGDEGQVFEGEFPTSGLFEQFTDDPGFAVADGNLGSGDLIDYNILSPLFYHDGTGFQPVTPGVSIQIDNNPNGSATVDENTDTVFGSDIPGSVGQADEEGGLHAHIDFTLTDASSGDAPPVGAYGFLTQVTTDASGIADSDPFAVVFNFGLDEEPFETGVESFATNVVPEPTSLAIAGILGTGLLMRRRRLNR